MCEHHAKFVGWRSKTYVSLFGEIRLLRSYYRCTQCGWREYPWDEKLGLADETLTTAARKIVSTAGVTTSFNEASERLLFELAGMRLSESTIQRTTESAGRRVIDAQSDDGAFYPEDSWKWHRDAYGQTCAYIGLDHTGVRQQGPNGERADGRMAAVALVANLKDRRAGGASRDGNARYVAGFYSLDEVVRRLRREAERVGLMTADRQIALTDGGAGLESAITRLFPNAVCILDFYHAKEHLQELANALHPTDEKEREAWLAKWLHCLKRKGGPTVLAALRLLDEEELAASVREVLRKQITYFTNHAHRMDYPTYLRHGWRIGSGPVESACKTVVGNRLKGGGMRWSEPGADAVARLRALYLSGPDCWRAFWNAPAG